MDKFLVDFLGTRFELYGVGAKAFQALVDECAGLRAENERLREDTLTMRTRFEAVCETRSTLQADTKRLRAEVERLREDAERYRWLRSLDRPWAWSKLLSVKITDITCSEDIDAAINAAMREGESNA